MTRLIIQEGGERRGFKIGSGKLSIGSGEHARLKLSDPNVAELHAEFEVSEGRVLLRMKPGVQPARRNGEPLPQEILMEHGVPVDIGGARLVIEYAGMPALREMPAAAPGPAAAPAARARAVAPQVQRGSARSGSSEPSARASNYRDRKRKQSSALVVMLLLGVPLIAFVGWKVLRNLTGEVGEEPEWQAEHRMRAARGYIADTAYVRAAEALDQAAADPDLTPDERSQIDALRAEIEAGLSRGQAAAHNMRGDEWLNAKLKSYEQNWLQDKPGSPQMRLFMRRLKDFKSDYPTHPELDWVERQIRRFDPLVDLAKPPSWEDVEFEATMAAGIGRNRITREIRARGDANWVEAFGVLDSYLTDATGEDRESALLLLDDFRVKRDEWVLDKLQQAKEHFDKAAATNWDSSELGRSIAWLVKIMRYSADPEAEADAAERFLLYQQSADLVGFLRGYKRDKPDAFSDLARNAVLKPFLAEQGLLD